MKGVIEFLKKLFRKIFKAIKKAIGWIMKNWKLIALAFVLAVMFLTPAFLASIGAGWLSGSAALVQSTLGVSSGWSLWAGIAAAGGAAILIAPTETANLVTSVAGNVAEVGGAVGSGVGDIVTGTVGGLVTSVVSGTTTVLSETFKAVAYSPITWAIAGIAALYLLWPSKKSDPADASSSGDTSSITSLGELEAENAIAKGSPSSEEPPVGLEVASPSGGLRFEFEDEETK